jgi:tetratricopeptide (TPR) repeat protein
VVSNPRIEELRKRLEKDPGSRLFAQLAEELRKAGELQEAIGVSRQGLEIHPAYPSARMTLGRALFDFGDLKGARAEFEAVLRSASDNILASRLLAECLEGLGHHAEAVTRYKATLAMVPGDKQVAARLQATEAKIARPTPPTVVADSVPKVEPAPQAPIPLAGADESFELERPYVNPAPSVPPPEAPIRSFDVTLPMGTTATVAGDSVDQMLELDAPVEAEAETAAAVPVEAESLSDRLPSAEPAPPPSEPARMLEPPEGAPPPPWLQPEAAVETEVVTGAAVPEPLAPQAPELISPTLAELYFNQGFTEKAADVYRQLLDQDPSNARARARLIELQKLQQHLHAEEAPRPPQADAVPRDLREARRRVILRTIARLEGMIGTLRRE